ncbi:MAG: hypothetical protein WBE14_17830, partial [Xanthobacteraceae bacterium]
VGYGAIRNGLGNVRLGWFRRAYRQGKPVYAICLGRMLAGNHLRELHLDHDLPFSKGARVFQRRMLGCCA